MIAVAIDPGVMPLAVAGRGSPLLRRLLALRDAGADPLVFCDRPDQETRDRSGGALRARLPTEADLAGLRALWIAGLPADAAAALRARASAQRLLVNVEDVRELCDFHNLAEVRRGDLLLTVSTNGRSPGLAARIRGRLAGQFGPEWATRLAALGERRRAWRAEGRSMPEIVRLTDETVEHAGWLR